MFFVKVKWIQLWKAKSTLMTGRWGNLNWYFAGYSEDFNLGSLLSFLWRFTLEEGEGLSKKFHSLQLSGQCSKLEGRTSRRHYCYSRIWMFSWNSKTLLLRTLKEVKGLLTFDRALRISSQNERKSLIFFRDWFFYEQAPRVFVSTSPPLLTKWTSDKLLAKRVGTVVLNLWVATSRGSNGAFTGVAYVGKHR